MACVIKVGVGEIVLINIYECLEAIRGGSEEAEELIAPAQLGMLR